MNNIITVPKLTYFYEKCKEKFALKADLANVATSGSYNDLSNKPTIPDEYTLPTASADTLGGVKIGENLNITSDGVLSAIAGSTDNTLDELLFQGKYTSNVEYISTMLTPPTGIIDIYFPKCTKITNSNLFSSNPPPTTCKLHFSVKNRKTIKASDGYPAFGSGNRYPTYTYDIDAVIMHVNRGDDQDPSRVVLADNVYVDNELVGTDDIAYIIKSTDTPVLIWSNNTSNGTSIKTDTVNSDVEFTYNAYYNDEGTNIGVSKITGAVTNNAVIYYYTPSSFNSLNFLTQRHNTLSDDNTYITIPTPKCTNISIDAKVYAEDTSRVLYTKNLEGMTGTVELTLGETDFTKANNYAKYLINDEISYETYLNETFGETITGNSFNNYKEYLLLSFYIEDTNVTSIGDYAFYNYTSLTTIDIPNVTSIGDRAFGDCTSLTTVNLPSVTSISDNAFYNCTSLTTIDLPNVTSISDNAFYYCTSLTTIDLPNATSISGSAFYNCTSLTTVNLPSVTSISRNAFENCKSLTTIDLPNATSISDYAFSSCTSLTTIDLPNVTSISDRAFYNCTSLTSIDLPNATSIGGNAFSGCSKLTTIHFSAANKSTIEALYGYSNKFGATNATIYFDL